VPDAEVFNSTAKTCGCGDPVDYEAVVDRLVTYRKSRTDKETRIERALGESIVQVLRRSLSSTGGKVKPAWRHLCDRLDDAPGYEYGGKRPLTRKTFYRYLDRHESKLDDVR
jgi:hypothetical protein